MKVLKLPKKSEFPAVVMIPTTITVLHTPEQMESEPLHFRSAGSTWTWLWVDLRSGECFPGRLQVLGSTPDVP